MILVINPELTREREMETILLSTYVPVTALGLYTLHIVNIIIHTLWMKTLRRLTTDEIIHRVDVTTMFQLNTN